MALLNPADFSERLTFLQEEDAQWLPVGTVWGRVQYLSFSPKITSVAAHYVRSQWVCVQVLCPPQSIINIHFPYKVICGNREFESTSPPKKSEKYRKVLNFLVLLRY